MNRRTKKAVVVDLGCGEKERRVSNSATVDLNYDDVDYAANLRDKLPFEDESVDVAFAQASFGYTWNDVDELRQRIDEVLRILRPGGVFIVFDYCQLYDEAEGDYRDVSPEQIREIWKAAAGERIDTAAFETEYAVLIRK